jgi:hypothetical protein
MCKNLEYYWKCNMDKMHSYGLSKAIPVVSSCGDSLFREIFYLIAIDFDVQSLRLYIVQSFCNAMKSGDHNALHCLHEYLRPGPIDNTTTIVNWKEYLVNMEMPYEKGKIEGGAFCLQWISFIFNVNIQVWSLHGNNIVNLYFAGSNCDKIVDVLSFETHTVHVHYEPLLREKYSEICDQHCDQWILGAVNTCGSKYDRDTILPLRKSMCDNVLVPEHVLGRCQDRHNAHCEDKITLENSSAIVGMGCHKAKRVAVENNRLSYHRLKKMICEKNKCNCGFPAQQGVKRHVHGEDGNSINATMW